jgi:hypothetical protein
MLRLIVDWVGRKIGLSHPQEIIIRDRDIIAPDIPDEPARPLAPELDALARELDDKPEPTPRELGIRFQHREFRRLLNAVGHWPTVEFFTANGAPIETMRDVPRGADGGIDVVIRVVADTELGAKRIAGRIRNMIVRQSY